MELIDEIRAELEKKTHGEQGYSSGDAECGYRDCAREILSFLDTLEVKEVDFEKELDKEWNKCEPTDEGMGLEIVSIEHEQFDNIAKHFFELGINARK